MRILCVFLVEVAWVFSLAACSSSVVVRTDYELTKFDDLLATNSQTIGRQPRRRGDHLEIGYSIVVKNLSPEKPYELPLEKAAFSVNGTATPMNCRGPSSLRTGESIRVDCIIVLTANGENRLALKDSEGWLTIPYSARGTEGAVKFRYKLKIEDFE